MAKVTYGVLGISGETTEMGLLSAGRPSACLTVSTTGCWRCCVGERLVCAAAGLAGDCYLVGVSAFRSTVVSCLSNSSILALASS